MATPTFNNYIYSW